MNNPKNIKPDVRDLGDMKEVIYDKEWLKTAPLNLELYSMYRDLAENETDKRKILDNGLRFDITIVLPVMLGKEFNKTLGHDHPIVPSTSITYPEIYEVLEGEAIFLLQDSDKDEIKDIMAVKAKKGEKVVIPPNYEHLIINASGKEVKTCNWLCRYFGSNIYKPFRVRHGFCYYAVKSDSEIDWIKNPNYESIPSLRWVKANNFYNFEIPANKPLYSLVNDLEKLNFLIEPQKYEWK
jgi:glucose-6-phosphate isomerase